MDNRLVREAIESLFTMTLTFDRELTILESSERLKSHLPEALPGIKLDELFEIHRPRGTGSFSDIIANRESLFLLVARNHQLALRGQVIAPFAEASEVAIFMGSPWLSWMSENYPERTLELADFPRHDSQMDQSFFINTQQAMVKDLEKINAELREAKEEAEQAKQVQSDFFAIMSHEMRTPLNGVISALSLIEETPDPKTRDELYDVARASANNLMSVINYVLDYSKLDAGKLEVELEDFDLYEAMDAVKDIVASRAARKELKVSVNLIDCPRWVTGDGSKVRQILLNLASNAVKFTDQGAVTITATGEPLDDDTVSVRFEVRDTGCGIPAEQQSKIFDAFWTSRTRTAGGEVNTGLGLNICQRIVTLLGGEISFTSTAGEGSSFTVDLPMRLAREVKTSSPDAPDIAATFDGDVLLVDDNQTNLLVGQMLLERLGLNVRTASDGAEAIEIAESLDFDLILMDITMPEMDGETATRQLREHGNQVPIIALTAHIGEGLSQRYIDAGMQDVVHKPINKVELIRAISRYLEKSAPGKTESTPDSASADSAAIDRGVIDTLIDSIGEENFAAARELFEKETASRISNLLAAWVQRDLELLTREAHTISSSAGSFGATVLSRQMKAVEVAGRDEDLPALIDLMKQVEPVYDAAMNEFKKIGR